MLLFTPGSTPVPEFARVAMVEETLHHRTPEFEAIFAQARTLLFELFGMDDRAFDGTASCIFNETYYQSMLEKAAQ